MDKIDLVLADVDSEYTSLFRKYVRESEFNELLLVRTFTKKEALIEFLVAKPPAMILLTTPDFLPLEVPIPIGSTIILLYEETSISESVHLSFYKYQSLHQIISKAIEKYTPKINYLALDILGKQESRVITVFSSTGGSGKTIFSLNLAREMAALNYKVFYLPLQVINTTSLLFPNPHSNNLSKMLYYVKAKSDVLVDKIKELHSQEEDGIGYLDSAIDMSELDEHSAEEVGVLIEAIKGTEQYDFIIIEADSRLNHAVTASFEHSDFIEWMILDNQQYLAITDWMLKTFEGEEEATEIRGKIHFLLNKYLGREFHDLSSISLNFSGYLPYVPRWKRVISSSEFFDAKEYSEVIREMITNFTK